MIRSTCTSSAAYPSHSPSTCASADSRWSRASRARRNAPRRHACSSGLHLDECSGDGVVVRLTDDGAHRRAYRIRQGDEQRPHRGHCRMGRSSEASMIVETTRDHRDADGCSLEARHDLFVASEQMGVASIADVPLCSLPTVADRLGCLGDQSLASRARRPPPFRGLVGRPGLLEPGTHRLEHFSETVLQALQSLASVHQS